MNYLAHAYLSFRDPGIVVGNMISDFVKGKKKYDFPADIQTGISLHRAIDAFTDAHEATNEAKQFFRPAYRLYAAAFTDVVYDHFLANDTGQFASAQVLQSFASETYQVLTAHENILPVPFMMMLPFMQQHDWLYNYRLREGMRRSFAGLIRRARFMNDPAPAFEVFEKNYGALQQCYDNFFPSLLDFATTRFQLLKTT